MSLRNVLTALSLILSPVGVLTVSSQAADLQMYWEEAGINGGTASTICAQVEEYLKGNGFSVRPSPSSSTDPLRMTATSPDISVFVQCLQDGSVTRILTAVAGGDKAAAEKLAQDMRAEAGKRPERP